MSLTIVAKEWSEFPRLINHNPIATRNTHKPTALRYGNKYSSHCFSLLVICDFEHLCGGSATLHLWNIESLTPLKNSHCAPPRLYVHSMGGASIEKVGGSFNKSQVHILIHLKRVLQKVEAVLIKVIHRGGNSLFFRSWLSSFIWIEHPTTILTSRSCNF